eukprot:4008532-Pyramimonas_sp.AAC.1
MLGDAVAGMAGAAMRGVMYSATAPVRLGAEELIDRRAHDRHRGRGFLFPGGPREDINWSRSMDDTPFGSVTHCCDCVQKYVEQVVAEPLSV